MLRFVLLAAFLATLVSAAVDPNAPNRDPSHGHIIMGGSALDRARALAWHIQYGHEEALIAHHPALPHQEDEDDDPAGRGAHVLSTRGAAGVTVLGSAGTTILARAWSFIPPPEALGRAAAPSSLPVIESTLLVPEPPPRAS